MFSSYWAIRQMLRTYCIGNNKGLIESVNPCYHRSAPVMMVDNRRVHTPNCRESGCRWAAAGGRRGRSWSWSAPSPLPPSRSAWTPTSSAQRRHDQHFLEETVSQQMHLSTKQYCRAGVGFFWGGAGAEIWKRLRLHPKTVNRYGTSQNLKQTL